MPTTVFLRCWIVVLTSFNLQYCFFAIVPFGRVRELHSVVGQIISLSPVVGNVSRLMSRNCQTTTAAVEDEDKLIRLDSSCLSELDFWHKNAARLNQRFLFLPSKINKIICSDASSFVSGAVICNDGHVAHKNLIGRR